jgi:hypothetical protein
MDHIAHLNHLGKYWKIFHFDMHLIFCHCLVTPQAYYTCDLGVGISTVVEIVGHFLLKMGRLLDHSVWSWPTYHQMLLDTKNKNTYGLGVAISVVFGILRHFLFKGTVPPCTDMICIPSDATWHEKREYIWFRDGDFNSFQDIWSLPVSRGTGPLRMVMTYIPSDAT